MRTPHNPNMVSYNSAPILSVTLIWDARPCRALDAADTDLTRPYDVSALDGCLPGIGVRHLPEGAPMVRRRGWRVTPFWPQAVHMTLTPNPPPLTSVANFDFVLDGSAIHDETAQARCSVAPVSRGDDTVIVHHRLDALPHKSVMCEVRSNFLSAADC